VFSCPQQTQSFRSLTLAHPHPPERFSLLVPHRLGPSSRNSTRPFFATLLTGLFGKKARLMSKQPQTTATYAFKCALLFLACAVFTWGLHAKLSLYKPPQSPSTFTVAKLLTERRSAQTIDSLKRAVQSDTAWQRLNVIPLLVLAQPILILTFEFYEVEMNLCRSRKGNLPHLTQRPPPAFF